MAEDLSGDGVVTNRSRTRLQAFSPGTGARISKQGFKPSPDQVSGPLDSPLCRSCSLQKAADEGSGASRKGARGKKLRYGRNKAGTKGEVTDSVSETHRRVL